MIRHQVAFLGRAFFALIFILAGLQKFQSFDARTGGPAVAHTAPKLDHLLSKMTAATGFALPISKTHYTYMVLAAAIAEVVGGVLFALDVQFGAYILMGFLGVVTPIMHNFWEITPPGSAAQEMEIVMFMKNLSMMGALIFYLAACATPRRTAAAAKKND